MAPAVRGQEVEIILFTMKIQIKYGLKSKDTGFITDLADVTSFMKSKLKVMTRMS